MSPQSVICVNIRSQFLLVSPPSHSSTPNLGQNAPFIPFQSTFMLASSRGGHCHACRSWSSRWPRSSTNPAEVACLISERALRVCGHPEFRAGAHQPDRFNDLENTKSTSPLVCQHTSVVCPRAYTRQRKSLSQTLETNQLMLTTIQDLGSVFLVPSR